MPTHLHNSYPNSALTSGQPIVALPTSVLINGICVEGYANLHSTHSMTVVITHPYQELSVNKQLSYFSRLANNKNFGDQAAAKASAQTLLTKIYQASKQAIQNRHKAKQTLAELEALKTKYASEHLSSEKRALKQRFKQGLLTQGEYQNTLTLIQEKQSQQSLIHKEAATCLMNRLFGDNRDDLQLSGRERFIRALTEEA